MDFVRENLDSDHLIVVGNKLDQQAGVSSQALDDLKTKFGDRFCLTSALTGDGIDDLFTRVAGLILADTKGDSKARKQEINVFPEAADQGPGTGCC
jgi:predicted GTPase